MTHTQIKYIGLLLLFVCVGGSATVIILADIPESYAQEPNLPTLDAMDIVITVKDNSRGNRIDFRNAISSSVPYADLEITVSMINPDNPVEDVSEMITFAHVPPNMSRFYDAVDDEPNAKGIVTIHTEPDISIVFTISLDLDIGLYTLPYNVTDSRGQTATGNLEITVVNRSPPTLKSLTITSPQGTSGEINFSGKISDNVVPFDDVPFYLGMINNTRVGRPSVSSDYLHDSVTFDLGRLLRQGNALGPDVEFREFGIFYPNVYIEIQGSRNPLRYTVHDDATIGLHNATYSASENFAGQAEASFTFTILENPLLRLVEDITASAQQSRTGSIDFGVITDNQTTFDDIIITIDPVNVDNPATDITTQLSFDEGAVDAQPDDQGRLTVNSQNAGFTVNDDVVIGTYNLQYTITNKTNPEFYATGNLTLTIRSLFDAMDIMIFAEPTSTKTIDFRNAISSSVPYEDLDITVSTINPDNPVKDVSFAFLFSYNNVNIPNDNGIVAIPTDTSNDPIQLFIGSFTPGVYNLQYSVTDNRGQTTTGNLEVTTDVRSPPTATQDIIISTLRGNSGTIDFAGIVSDNVVPFDDLRIRLGLINNTRVNESTGYVSRLQQLDGQVTFDIGDILSQNGIIKIGKRGTLNEGKYLEILGSQNPIRYTVNIDAGIGTYDMTYSVTDDTPQSGPQRIFEFTILENTFLRLIQNITVTAQQSRAGSIDFGVITDDQTTFDDIIITIDPVNADNPASDITTQLSFDEGAVDAQLDEQGRLTVNSQNAGFTVNTDAAVGAYRLQYTIANKTNPEFYANGNLTLTIESLLEVRDIVVSAEINSDSNRINFKNAITSSTPYEDLVIAFSGRNDDNPIRTIGQRIKFYQVPGDDRFILDDRIRINTNSKNITIPTTNPDIPIVFDIENIRANRTGVYNLPYNVTDSYGRTATANLQVNVLTIALPTANDDMITTIQGKDGQIDFAGIVSDNAVSFDDLRISLGLINNTIVGSDDVSDIALYEQVRFDFGDIITDTSRHNNNCMTNYEIREFGVLCLGRHVEIEGLQSPIRYTVNDDAVSGVYDLRYIVADNNVGHSSGNIEFIIIENPLLRLVEDITVTAQQSRTGSIDFGVLVDNRTAFDDLTVGISSINTGNPASDVTTQLSFDEGAVAVQQPDGQGRLTINEQNAGFTVNDDAVIGTYRLQYTITNKTNPEFHATGNLTLTIERLVRNTDPIILADEGIGIITLNQTVLQQSNAFSISLPLDKKNLKAMIQADANNISDTDLLSIVISDISQLDTNIPNGLRDINDAQQFRLGDNITYGITDPNYSQVDVYSLQITFNNTLNNRVGTGNMKIILGDLSICVVDITTDAINFGILANKNISDGTSFITINNTGTRVVLPGITADNWISTTDSAIIMMNAHQTRWSLNSSISYADKTPLSFNVMQDMNVSLATSAAQNIYLQLLVDLIDGKYQGRATQNMMITSICS